MKITNSGAPCKNCTERELGCHSRCSLYIKWSEEHTRDCQKKYMERSLRNTLETLHVQSASKGVYRRNSSK